MKSAEPSLPAATPSAKEETLTSGGPAATPSDPARCEVCHRVSGQRTDNCIRQGKTPDLWAAICYQLGYERLLSERRGLRAEAFEEAARACEGWSAPENELQIDGDSSMARGLRFAANVRWRIAASIRALAATSAPQDKPKVTK